MSWNYKREEAKIFEELPEGNYRTVIESVELAVSKRSGNNMFVIKMAVSGSTAHLWHYIPFLEDRPEVTNRMLTAFFDSFGIDEGDFNTAHYTGKAGGVHVKHDEEGRAKISYLLTKDQQSKLPPWEGQLPNMSVDVVEDDIPF